MCIRDRRYSVSELSMVLLIQSEEELPAEELKKALEEMNYEFYSCLKVQSYTGISTAVQEPLEISRPVSYTHLLYLSRLICRLCSSGQQSRK